MTALQALSECWSFLWSNYAPLLIGFAVIAIPALGFKLYLILFCGYKLKPISEDSLKIAAAVMSSIGKGALPFILIGMLGGRKK